MIIIQLNERQLKIIAIVKENEPITGEKIAEKLRVTRATLRSDLVVLTMTGILDARPKVGYFYVGEGNFSNENTSMKNTKVSSVMGVPLTARQSDSVYDVIVNIFLEDSGGVFILDEDDYLCGVVSRKDLLKATVGGSDVNKLPVGMIMTRMPNIATVEEDESINLAASKLMKREVDSLPVIRYEDDDKQKMKVVGKISKTIINRLFVELTE
ncbi:MAG: helix-turn-helix transcriptional regulator [Peptostreptococcus sp.]|uniref:helix-turn-helix transcriptional regulator n=1 Tax=Peptostreptococcus sp. TaxID=1262 RepID=UPI001CADC617|nr:helix-turn-helix transcriptional regulator [Peptostreptococcus sp.]MBF1048097.1 helix-turn-helix transcriptional regulator [Peptostreptococcus sp.]MBF1049514.1 helix-turn-helix transcriptional regulator [Peptostreptococcus sp.]MBF1064264.1 helix-turn-helix transcriptional regulator [Peptostreptococcus sp.]